MEVGAGSLDILMQEQVEDDERVEGDMWVDIEADAGELEIEEAFLSAIKHMSS